MMTYGNHMTSNQETNKIEYALLCGHKKFSGNSQLD